MTDEWPESSPEFWERLASRPAGEVCSCSGAVPAGEGRFELRCLHETWLVDASTREVTKVSGDPACVWDGQMPFLVLAYVSSATEAELTGEMVPPRDLMAGQDYFQGHNTITTRELEGAFGSDAGSMLDAAPRLGGVQTGQADASVRFHVFPKLPVEHLLWVADEEFPAKVSILLDRGTPRHYPVEGVAMAVNLLTRRLIVAAGEDEG